MWSVVFTVLFLGFAESLLENDLLDKNEVKIEHFVYWPNATVPFYIHPEHFDHEQSSIILTALTNFAFKTCLKFLPALVAPTNGQHVLVIENPNGVRQCVLSTSGHTRDEPHYMVLGYDCLHSPQIDMMLMKAIGFSFEHNRAIRDLYIRVQKENVNPSAMDLFVMDDKLPTELRALPYDVNSVMHFGEREYSKNGHRTILVLDHKVKQCREGLSETDVRKIDIVYGPECRKRDRLEKIDLCQGYPGVARKKRAVVDDDIVVEKSTEPAPTEVKSLRVNPNITPPAGLSNTTQKDKNVEGKDLNAIMGELGIKYAVEEITNLVYKLGARALTNLRIKHCNASETNTTNVEVKKSGRRSEEKKPDIFGVVEMVAEYVQDMVDHALTNLTSFCEVENDLKVYQRQRWCNFNSGKDRCPVIYKSTKTGAVMYSTKHRPYIPQSTKHEGSVQRFILYHQNHRRDGGDDAPDGDVRKKRDAESGNLRRKRGIERRFEGRRYNVSNQSDGVKWDQSEVSMEANKPPDQDGAKDTKEGKPVDVHRVKHKDASAPLPKVVELSKKNREFYGERMWPDGFVRYVVTEDKKYDLNDLRRRLGAVNRILKERTCVSLEEITEEDAERFEDYLVLDGSADYITGKVGGRQNFGTLELFEGGQHKQHAAMMVMAMLGFYFELARHDRDKYVRVHLRHVRPDKLHHFEKIRSDATLPLPYDYESATHPAWQFWRQIGKTGISTVATYKEMDPDGSIMRSLGQHDHLLSETDIVKINSVYGLKCFDKKPERNNDNIDNDSVIQEVDLDKEKEPQEESKKPKNIHELETWTRPKHKNREEGRHKDNEEGRHKNNEDRYKNNENRHKNNEQERHKDEEERNKDDEEERHKNNEEDRHKRENHGRNRDRHRNKHEPEREEDYDDARERNRDRHSKRYESEREREHEQERDKNGHRDKHGREHENSDKYREDRDIRGDRGRHGKERNMHKKRSREMDEENEEQERNEGKHGRIDKGRGRHEDEESDRDRHRQGRDREGRHGRHQNRAEESERYNREDDRHQQNEMDVEDETGAEGPGGYRQRHRYNERPDISGDNNPEGRGGYPENSPDYNGGQPIAYQEDIRRRRGQMVAPVKTN